MGNGKILGLPLLVLAVSALSVWGEPGPDEIQRVYEMTEESIKWETYKKHSHEQQELLNVEIWTDAPQEDLPTGLVYSGINDFQGILLARGLARLRPGIEAPEALLDAQAAAMRQELGMWGEKTEPPTGAIGILLKVTSRFWNFVSKPAGFLSTLGLLATIAFGVGIPRWRHHHHNLKMVILGEPSAGKTWLYSRLVEREISIPRLEALPSSSHRTQVQTEPLLMGPFTISPILTDLPGSRPGQHLSEILGGRAYNATRITLLRTRLIWILTLSTTQNSHVLNNLDHSENVQGSFISRQLGYLRLPQAVLANPAAANPALVILCITKVDLLMEHRPGDSSSTNELDLIKSLFSDHREMIKAECVKQGIPYEEVYLSARENWGFQKLYEAIRRNLYLRTKQ